MEVQHSLVQEQSCTWQGMAPNDNREGDQSTSPPLYSQDSCIVMTNRYMYIIIMCLLHNECAWVKGILICLNKRTCSLQHSLEGPTMNM